MRKDIFTHLDEHLILRVQVRDSLGEIIPCDKVELEFATSLGVEESNIEILSLGDGIEMYDNEMGIYEITFFPTLEKGYDSRNILYQIRSKVDEKIDICLEGRIFIKPSLFD